MRWDEMMMCQDWMCRAFLILKKKKKLMAGSVKMIKK
jgi:hypothetical protein